MTKCHLSAAICSVNWSRWFAHQVGRTLKHWKISLKILLSPKWECIILLWERPLSEVLLTSSIHIWTGVISKGVFLWSEVTCCEVWQWQTLFWILKADLWLTGFFEWLENWTCSYVLESLFFSTPGLYDPVSILFQASSLALYGTLSSSTWICFTLCRKEGLEVAAPRVLGDLFSKLTNDEVSFLNPL